MGQAVAKVLSLKGAPRGTAFAISRDLALTAFHCIGDRMSGEISLPTVSLQFLDGPTLTASFHGGNRRLDFALLKLESSLPNALEPIPIATEVVPHERFRCMGYPAAVRGPDYMTIGGEVRNPAGSLFEGVPAIQLYSDEAAARLELPGMSGGPVLVGKNPEVVVGIIRWNPQHPDGTAQAQGGVVFACPIKNVMEEFSELEVPVVPRVHHKAPLDAPDVLYWFRRPASLGDSFVGREDELEAITNAFKEHRVVVISGGAATGKSRLAAEYTHRSQQVGFWTTAGTDLPQTLIGLEPSLGVSLEGSEEDIVNGVLRRLHVLTQDRGASEATPPLLWVVDNLADLNLVNELTQDIGPINLLITTRSARQENLPRTAAFIELQVLKPGPAIELLSSHRRRDSSWDQSDPALRNLAEEVGRLPLALEMLAVRLGGPRQTPKRILDQLRKADIPIKELEVFQKTAGATIPRAEGVYATTVGALDELSPEVRERISSLGYTADQPMPDSLLGDLTDLESEPLNQLIEECIGRSIFAEVGGQVVVHALTIAAIEATNRAEEPGTALYRAASRLYRISEQADMGAMRLEIAHYQQVLERTRRVLGAESVEALNFANNLANGYRSLGRYQGAVALDEETLAIRERVLGPEHPDTLMSRGNLASGYLNLGRYQETEEDYTIAIARGMDDADVYYYRGMARYYQDNYSGAEEDYTIAIARGMDDADVYYNRGLARYSQDNYSGAEEDLTTAIARGRDDADVYCFRAYANVRLERLEPAQRDCEQAEERASGQPLTHVCWGDLHLALREYDYAIAHYESALEAASGTDWHFELALALLLAGRFDDAKTAYSRGLVEESASDIRVAISELEFWTEREADSITSTEGKETVSTIRRDLQSGLEDTLHS